jgi:hypothetical protein
LPNGPSTTEPASAREDLGGGGSGQGSVEPAVELGEIGGRIDLALLVLRRLKLTGIEDLENVLGLGPNGALDDALFPALLKSLLDADIEGYSAHSVEV